MRDLFKRMEAEKTAEALNDNVIIPFAAALEEICRARGYVLNIYGEAFMWRRGGASTLYIGRVCHIFDNARRKPFCN